MIRKILVVGLVLIGAGVAYAVDPPARYDRATEVTITGTILHVASAVSADGTVGVHLDLKTADGLVGVAVAPALFIGQNNFWFAADDRVEIIGSRIVQEGKTIWARAVTKGSEKLVLRNEDGVPRWTPAIDGTDGCGVVHPTLPRITE